MNDEHESNAIQPQAKESSVADEVKTPGADVTAEVGDATAAVTIEEQAPTRQTVPVLPLRGTVVLPMTVVPLAAAQPRSLRLIDAVASGDRTVALVMQNDAEQEAAGPGETRTIGTLGMIHQMMRVPDGSVRLAVQGVKRVR